jgi:glycerol kinase
MWGDSLSYFINFNFHQQMTKSNENVSKVNNSSRTSTPDCESVKQYDNLLNLLPQQAKMKQENGKDNASSVYGNATTGIFEKNCESVKVGRDANNANIQIGENLSCQTNHVQENRGVTGITGTGHTINIYQYPKSLEDLLTKILTKKGGIL